MSPGLGMSGSSQAPSLYDTMKHGNSAAYLENMESQLKMKEGKYWGEESVPILLNLNTYGLNQKKSYTTKIFQGSWDTMWNCEETAVSRQFFM